jgi:hypothetical protein
LLQVVKFLVPLWVGSEAQTRHDRLWKSGVRSSITITWIFKTLNRGIVYNEINPQEGSHEDLLLNPYFSPYSNGDRSHRNADSQQFSLARPGYPRLWQPGAQVAIGRVLLLLVRDGLVFLTCHR